MKLKAISLIALISLSLTGCAGAGETPEPTKSPFAGITIVSSTNVWADVAKSIGGDKVEVLAIIDSFSKDPHSYEASARDQLAVNGADLILANGGGYDSFIDKLAAAAGNENVVYAYLPGQLQKQDKQNSENLNHDHSADNEHVWYDFHIVEDFANRLTEKLTELDPENSADYKDNLVLFLNEVQILEDRTSDLISNLEGSTVMSSEPIADYLLAELGLINITPKSFAQAIEEEQDVSPKDLLEIQNLLKNKKVDLFVVNPQTGSVQVESLVALAEQNTIPVVELSELLPAGQSYFEWMDNNIAKIEQSLR